MMTTTVNMYIDSSRREHLQEAEDRMGDGVGWLGGRCRVTPSFLSIVKISFAGCIRRRGGLPKSRISRIDC